MEYTYLYILIKQIMLDCNAEKPTEIFKARQNMDELNFAGHALLFF